MAEDKQTKEEVVAKAVSNENNKSMKTVQIAPVKTKLEFTRDADKKKSDKNER